MQKVYKTKYTWWMVAIMIGLVLLYPAFMMFEGFSWIMTVVCIVVVAFFLDFLLRVSYTIDGDKLKLRAGLFHITLDIGKIKSITSKKTLLNGNSFAMSTDRLTILMPHGYKYMVSPRDKEAFIADLLHINPKIEVT